MKYDLKPQTHVHTHKIYLHIGRSIRDNERDLVFFFLPVFDFAATTAKIGHSGRGKIPMESWNTKPSGEVTLGVPSTMVR